MGSLWLSTKVGSRISIAPTQHGQKSRLMGAVVKQHLVGHRFFTPGPSLGKVTKVGRQEAEMFAVNSLCLNTVQLDAESDFLFPETPEDPALAESGGLS